MKIIISLISLSILIGCSPFKLYKFKSETFFSNSDKKYFQILIPRGFKNIKKINLEPDILKEFVYSDTTVLYISLDITFSNSPNRDNWMKCSIPSEGIKCISGKQTNNLFWKEIISNNLVIGYYNVSFSRKNEFDNALESLIELSYK